MRLRPRHTQGTVTPSPAATKLKKTQEGIKTPRSRRPVGIKEPRPGATASKMATAANDFESEPAAILPEDTQKDHAAPAHLTSRASGDGETERTAPAGLPSLLGAAASPTSPTRREDRSIAMRPERTTNEVPEPSTDIGRTSGPHILSSNSFHYLASEEAIEITAPTKHTSPGEREPSKRAPADFLTQDGFRLVSYRQSQRAIETSENQRERLYTVLFRPSLAKVQLQPSNKSKITQEIRSRFNRYVIPNIRLNPTKNIIAVDTPYVETRDKLLLITKLDKIEVYAFPAIPENASVGTVHQIIGEQSLQAVRTLLQSRHTILDITRKGQGTSVSVVFQGPNAPDHVTLGSQWYRVYPSGGREPKRQVSYNYDQQSTIEEPLLAPTSRRQSQEENNIRTWSPTFAAALSAGRRDKSTAATQPRLPAERAARNISPRRKDATTIQRRRGRSLSKRQFTWIRGDKDAPGQPPSLSKGHSQHSKRSSLHGSTASKGHNIRGKSVPSPRERSQLRRGMTGGRHIEPFGLPELPICGANLASHSDLLCGDVDMRRTDSVRRTSEISRRGGGTREKSRSRSTNRSNLNEQDGSKKNHDESRHPRRTTGLPFKAASGPYPPSPTPKHQPSAAPLPLFPLPPRADATGALPTPRKDAPAAAPPLFSTMSSMAATSAPPTQCKCGHPENQSELALQNYHQQCIVTEMILHHNLIPLVRELLQQLLGSQTFVGRYHGEHQPTI